MQPEAGTAAAHRRALECLVGVPATDGNQVDVFGNGHEALAAMLDAIAGSSSTVDLQTYGHWSGTVGSEFTAALVDRARAGVRVRVLLDSLGTGGIDRRLVGRMEEAGAMVAWFRPLTNWRVTQSTHRGHRKALVCDGSVAFTGGCGIADDWRAGADHRRPRRDTELRLRGPAVNGVRGAFVNNWAETGLGLFDEAVDPLPGRDGAGRSAVQVVQGDAETGWGDISTLARCLVGLARSRLRISAGYLVPDPALLELLCAAARRGVSVEVLRPAPRHERRLGRLASQSCYAPLLEAGARLWTYQPAPFDTRVITVDGEVASIGPVNFNARSLTLNDEVNVVVLDAAVARVLDSHFDADLQDAVPVEHQPWAHRSRLEHGAQAAVGYLARRL